MRRVSVVLPVLAVLAVLATLLLLLGDSPARAQGIAHFRHVEAQVFGTVAIGMPDPHTIAIQHLDPATGQWDAPTTLVRTRGRLTCGDIEGRASAGGFAVLAECDRPYYADQAPVHSIALFSRDGRSWSRSRLPGEAYLAPAIAPNGQYAAWLDGAGTYVEWSASTGFLPGSASGYRHDSGGETLVVDDTGTVTVLGPEPRGGDCVVGIHSRDLAGARTHSVVEGVDPGCTEGTLDNVDALTVTGGVERAERFTISRPAVGQPWTLTRIRPVDAPGLVDYGHSRTRIATGYLETTDLAKPLVALGSPDRHRIYVQRYDDATQTWGPQTLVHTSGKPCVEGYEYTEDGRALYVDALHCRVTVTLLVSSDAGEWTVGRAGRRPWTATSSAVVVPGVSITQVGTAAGVQQFPAAIDGPCDVAVPGRPGELVRLHGGRGWPAKVQVSTGGAFKTVSIGRRLRDTCRRVVVDNSRATPLLTLRGERERYARLRLRDGTWTVAYPKNPYRRADS
jgi:hypothetical protein